MLAEAVGDRGEEGSHAWGHSCCLRVEHGENAIPGGVDVTAHVQSFHVDRDIVDHDPESIEEFLLASGGIARRWELRQEGEQRVRGAVIRTPPVVFTLAARSEERRVGKECRAWVSPYT